MVIKHDVDYPHQTLYLDYKKGYVCVIHFIFINASNYLAILTICQIIWHEINFTEADSCSLMYTRVIKIPYKFWLKLLFCLTCIICLHLPQTY
jgi:hypothetical protein